MGSLHLKHAARTHAANPTACCDSSRSGDDSIEGDPIAGNDPVSVAVGMGRVLGKWDWNRLSSSFQSFVVAPN